MQVFMEYQACFTFFSFLLPPTITHRYPWCPQDSPSLLHWSRVQERGLLGHAPILRGLQAHQYCKGIKCGALRPDQPSSCFSSNRGYRLRDMLCYGCLINDEDMVLVCTNILPFLTVAKLSSTRKLGSRVTLEGTSAGGGTQDSKCWSSTT